MLKAGHIGLPVFHPIGQASDSESMARTLMEGRPAGAGSGGMGESQRETSTSLSMARSAQISHAWPGHTWACCPARRRREVRAKDCRYAPPLPPMAPFCGS